MNTDDFTLEELEAQHTAALPGRHLLVGLGLLIPVLDVACVELYVGTDPVELFVGVYA